MAARFACAGHGLDLRGQREKLCLPSSFCEEPPQLWHCPPRGCSTTACPAPLPLPDHPPRTVQVSFKAQMQEDAHFPTSYWSPKSSSSLSCSLGTSSQHLDSTSQKSAFKKCQPSAAPSPRGKAPRDTESCGKLQTGSLPSTAPQRDVGGPRSIFSPSQTQQKQQWEELGGGDLSQQTPSVILGLVRCQRGVLGQQPPIGAKAGRTDFVAFLVGKVPASLSLQEPRAPGGQVGAALLASPSAAAASQHQPRCP